MKKEPNHRKKNDRLDLILGVFAVITVVIAWFYGASRAGASVLPALDRALPAAANFENLENGTYQALDENGVTIGYVSVGEAVGYGGPMEVAVAINDQGEVIGFSIASHKETPSFLESTRQQFCRQSGWEDLPG